MATGNLLLGLGRRSIGDITLYRTRGQQRARVRVREIANPRTLKQLATRAILSNVSQLYSLGRPIFDHSFEGRPVGQENQLRFQKVNIARLRGLVNTELTEQIHYDEATSRIGMRGVSMGVPFRGMQISEGSLSQNVFVFDGSQTESRFAFALDFDDAADNTVGKFCQRRGIKGNDIFTFVGLVVNKNITIADLTDPDTPQGDEDFYQIFQTELYYVQLKVAADAETSTVALNANSVFSDVFTVYGANTSVEPPILNNRTLSDGQVNWSDLVVGIGQSEISKYVGCWGCIRSRYNTDLRSTSFMENQGTAWGLSPADFLERAWGDSGGLNTDPTLILPGENF